MNRFLSIGAILFSIILITVYWKRDDDKLALSKYYQAVDRVVDNYVEEPSLPVLLKGSLAGLANAVNDSVLVATISSLDTTQYQRVNNVHQLREHFRASWEMVLQKTSVPSDSLADAAIRGMLADLDPHSVYIDPRTSARVMEDFEGRFSGIGLSYEIITDTATVIYVQPDGPAEKGGLRPGDKILAIDTTSIVGIPIDDIRNLIRGPESTEVRITRRSHGAVSADTLSLYRASVPLYALDASYMLDSETGYIRMNRFSATTHNEFITAADSLKRIGMSRMILDLRNNGGGYLQQALLLIDEFLDGNDEVLSTQSRHQKFSTVYKASRKGRLHDMPLIILVNQSSASASEVLSGALQDYDRALIVGRRTFGKGLVQQQFVLNDRSLVRVTTSRYYTPSGRLIQKPYINGREDYAAELSSRARNAESDIRNYVEHLPDSLVYYTRSGRKVYGGGGIVPDHILADSLTSPLVPFIRAKRLHYPLLFGWIAQQNNPKQNLRPESLFPSDFEVRAETHFTLNSAFVLSDTLSSESHISGDTLFIRRGAIQRDLPNIMAFLQAEGSRMIWGQPGFWRAAGTGYDQVIVTANTFWDEYYELAEVKTGN